MAELAPSEVELMGDRFRQAEAAEHAASVLRPDGPHYFLATVGVVRRAQGQGHSAAGLAPTLAVADATGTAACLETSSEGNVRFYRRLGLRVTGEVEVPGGGPHV